MKKLFCTLTILGATILSATNICAQDKADKGECLIPVAVVVDNTNETIPQASATNLETSLNTSLTRYGLGGNPDLTNFCMVASVEPASSQVVAGTRPVVTISAYLNLVVSNIVTGEKFTAAMIDIKGASQNETSAYMAAIKQAISAKNKEVDKFMKDTSAKLVDYYNKNVPNIIRSANQAAVQRNFEKAFWILTSVPTCAEGYEAVEERMVELYQEAIDIECSKLVLKAESIWASSPTKEGAAKVADILSQIDPKSVCYDEVSDLIDEIKEEMKRKIELEEYADEFERQIKLRQLDLQEQYIEAVRQIGIEYGKNQVAPILVPSPSPIVIP